MQKVVILWILVIFSASLEAKGDFLKKLLQLEKAKVIKIIQRIPKGSQKVNKVVINKNKFPKLIPFLKESPEKIYLANRSLNITKRGAFEKNFFSRKKFSKQLEIIAQSSKYGDNYFKVIKEISSISPRVIQKSLKFSKSIDVNKINKLNLQKQFIDTLNKTGKYGWKNLVGIQKWIFKNPKFSGASAMYIWYIFDPSGFTTALKESGKNLTEFLGSSMKTMLVGAGEAIIDKVEEIGQSVMDSTVDNFKNVVKNDLTEESLSSFKYIFVFLSPLIFFFILRRRKTVKKKVSNQNSRKIKNTKENNEF